MTTYRIVETTDGQNLGMELEEPELHQSLQLRSGSDFIVERKTVTAERLILSNENYVIYAESEQ